MQLSALIHKDVTRSSCWHLTDAFEAVSFHGRTCREPPWQNLEVGSDVTAGW